MERSTKQSQALQEIMTHICQALSPEELLAKAQEKVNSIGIATIYRYLKRGMELGTIRAVNLSQQPLRYEWIHCNAEKQHDKHHHHFHCRSCQRVLHIHACPKHLEQLVPAGYTIESHDLVFYGICDACKK